MGASNAGLEHPPAPYGDAALHRRVVHRDRLGAAPDASVLDVDDSAGLPVDRGQSIPPVADGLVKADGGIHPLLQHGVVVEIVCPQGLLDHEEALAVEADQM